MTEGEKRQKSPRRNAEGIIWFTRPAAAEISPGCEIDLQRRVLVTNGAGKRGFHSAIIIQAGEAMTASSVRSHTHR